MTGNPYRVVIHPLVFDDVARLDRHGAEATGDPDAGKRRVVEIDALIRAIAEAPKLGPRLEGRLSAFRRRHGGADRRITIIYASDHENRILRIHLVAFGGQDGSVRAVRRPEVPMRR